MASRGEVLGIMKVNVCDEINLSKDHFIHMVSVEAEQLCTYFRNMKSQAVSSR